MISPIKKSIAVDLCNAVNKQVTTLHHIVRICKNVALTSAKTIY